jgi:hypothetical protein
MNLLWFDNDLHVLGRNKVFALLIRKANRADRFWATLERWIRFDFRREQ